MKIFFVLCLLGLYLGAIAQDSDSDYSLVYATSSTDADSEGIIIYHLNLNTGELKYVQGIKGIPSASFLAFDHNNKHLYCVNEGSQGLYAYSVDQTNGSLTFLNKQPSDGGPVYVFVDYSNSVVLTANYGAGTVYSFPIQEDGSLGEVASKIQHHGHSVNPDRQEGPHAHFVMMDPTNKYAMSVDLGTDQVLACSLNTETAELTPLDPPDVYDAVPGAGPRHLIWHPNGKFVYIIHEMGNIMVAASYDSNSGRFTVLQTVSTLPNDFTSWSFGDAVNILPNGKFLYGSNRGDQSNNIVVYAIDQDTGMLTEIQFMPVNGNYPRDFTIDPSGRVLLIANEKSNNVATYLIDSETGLLTDTGYSVDITVPQCLKVIPNFEKEFISI